MTLTKQLDIDSNIQTYLQNLHIHKLSLSASSLPIVAIMTSYLDPANYPQTIHLAAENIHLELTYFPLSPTSYLAQTRSPLAGANILFLGTTRNTSLPSLSSSSTQASPDGTPLPLPVARLAYSSYAPLALRTLTDIARAAVAKHQLCGLSIAHRLGEVGVGEESIAIAVSAPHRGAAWRAGEEVLEECKRRVEIWKREEFAGATGEDGEGGGGWEWRANKDTDAEGRKKQTQE